MLVAHLFSKVMNLQLMQGSECNELISDMEQSSAALLIPSKLVLDLSGLQAPLQITTSWF